MRRILDISALTLILLLAVGIFPQNNDPLAQKRVPQFTDYPSQVIQTRRSIRVDIGSTPYTSCFRTMLRKTAQNGVKFAGRYGVGPTMLGATFTIAVAALLIPLAGGALPVIVAVLAFALFLQAFGISLNGINLVSLRQAMTPTQLQGRMNATFRFLNLIAATIGALLAGELSEVIGLRLTLVIGACGLFIPFLRLLISPARNLLKVEPTA